MRVVRTCGGVALIAVLMLTVASVEAQFPRPVQTALGDLSQRSGVAQHEITVVGFEEVTWPDASLGAPRPGEVYAQVQTPGYRVTLEAAGNRYVYHTDMQERAVAVTPQVEPTPDPEVSDLLWIVARAKEHLARTAGIDEREVFLASVEEHTWPDASLGRPDPGQAYAQVQTPGYRIILEHAGGLEAYHTDRRGVIVAPDGSRIATAPAELPVDPEQPAFVRDAIQDLSGRHGVSPAEVSVVSVEAVQWPDGARGLPEPGMMYTQALVPGHRIVLSVGGREFAYHESDGRIRYAGHVWAEEADRSLLTLYRVEQTDGNNLYHLQRVDPVSGEAEIVTEFITSFDATPDGRLVLLNVRRSRSEQALEILGRDGTRTEVATAFEFTDMALRPDGQVVAAWQRQQAGDRDLSLHIYWQPWDQRNAMQVRLPDTQVELRMPTRLVWTDDGVAASVITRGGPRSFFVTPDGQVRSLGEIEVFGWVPRTQSLLAAEVQADGTQRLYTLIPGRGETMQLATARGFVAAAAPYEERYILAAADDGEGRVSLKRIDWGGSSVLLKEYAGIEDVELSVAPRGEMVAVESRTGVLRSTEVLRMPTLETLLTVVQPGPAQLFAD